MKENNIINKALELLDESPLKAYEFLLHYENQIEDKTGQTYNFLYCLAALANDKEASLRWLEEAIINQKLWYRPEVFEDDDLELICDDLRFKKCVELSNFRYENALKSAESQCTWKVKTKEKLLLVLHGNQQNIQIAKQQWDQFKDYYQVEYLQSSSIDSKDLYRWEIDGPGAKELAKALDLIELKQYKSVTLAGFSAGCHVVLKAIEEENIYCQQVILQSPWIPNIINKSKALLAKIKNKKIALSIICGTNDEDCYHLAKHLVESGVELNVKLRYKWIEGGYHDYPNEFKKIVLETIQ